MTFIRKKYCIAACILIMSCSTTKYVGQGEYLLDQVTITTDSKAVKPSDLKRYLQQQPNFKIFGIFRWPLHLYSMSGSNEKKWLNRQLRKMGEPPVIFDTMLTTQSKTQLQRYVANKGFVDANVEMSVDTTSHRKKAMLMFSITLNEPYRISTYSSEIQDRKIDSLIHLKPVPVNFTKSLLRSSQRDYISNIKESMLFDRTLLDLERQRLTTILRRNGYYKFNRDFIGYIADSAHNNHRVDLKLDIRPFRNDTAYIPHSQYRISSVRILTDYDPLSPDASGANWHATDSAVHRGIKIMYGQNGRSIRPAILQQSNYITPGRLFNERALEQTYTSYSSLNALRYMSVRFDEVQKGDSVGLDVTILTAPAKKQGVRFDVEGTNSAGDLGFASSLTYQHRNFFRSSELLSAKIRGGYEYLSATNEKGNYWEFAGEASIRFPHFLFPFVSYDFRRKIRATTEFHISYDQQRRPEYYRAIVSGGWIYHWQDRLNTLARHTFKLLDINYVFLPHIEQSFKDRLPETTALYNYSDQFVVSTGYVWTYNNYDPQERRDNTYSLRVAFEEAGNLMYGVARLLTAERDAHARYRLFGINFSQFIKGDLDFARSLTIDARNTFAFHLGVGLAYPYGNTKEIPFERRYYAGGANSNRGWSVRSLGPGSMKMTDSTSFIHQVGDIRLDANIEYRSKLFWKLELALFVDAGNVWTIHKYDYQPSGDFDFSRFYQEIAISYGLGVRFDFNYFLLRLDAGLKAYNPQASGADRWAVYHPNLKNNFAWHFAVGYPF